MDVRPMRNQEDDVIYIDDHDVTVVKTEECERRRVFVKSDLPYLGPIRSFVISDSEESGNEDGAGPSRIKGERMLSVIPFSDQVAKLSVNPR